MKFSWKKILIVLAVGGVSFVIYAIVKAIIGGVRDLKTLALAPFTAAQDAYEAVASGVSKVAGNVSAAASLPSLTQTEAALTVTDQNLIGNDYAPGGKIYNQILASKGQAAADAAWANVQSDYAAQALQDSADSSLFGFGSW